MEEGEAGTATITHFHPILNFRPLPHSHVMCEIRYRRHSEYSLLVGLLMIPVLIYGLFSGIVLPGLEEVVFTFDVVNIFFSVIASIFIYLGLLRKILDRDPFVPDLVISKVFGKAAFWGGLVYILGYLTNPMGCLIGMLGIMAAEYYWEAKVKEHPMYLKERRDLKMPQFMPYPPIPPSAFGTSPEFCENCGAVNEEAVCKRCGSLRKCTNIMGKR